MRSPSADRRPVRPDTGWRRAARIASALALTFSYSLAGALVPASVPQTLLVRTAIWAAELVLLFAAQTRLGHRPFGRLWRVPRTRWAVALSMAMVGAVAAAVAIPPPGRSTADLVRITMIGVIGEEVLFRGIVWDLLSDPVRARAHATSPIHLANPIHRTDPVPLIVTTLLFGVAHIQYNGFLMDWAVTGQIGYALVAGAVLGWLRDRTGSLTPSLMLHATGNAVLKLGWLVLG